MTVDSLTTIHTDITATSFRLLGMGLRLLDMRYGEERRGAELMRQEKPL